MPTATPNLAAGAVAFAILCCGLGCQHTNWHGPAGPMNQQQAVAAVHDPFPVNDIGPTDNAMRPPGYQQPLPEPVRDRLGPDSMPWLGQ